LKSIKRLALRDNKINKKHHRLYKNNVGTAFICTIAIFNKFFFNIKMYQIISSPCIYASYYITIIFKDNL